ncbi:zinc ABC transporter permease subunit ZnuB [Thioalbus denitrificans]|uniref:High-affinity zinc uptake system membrane protein ZnuB n=1 Tax=Thioalbus denitrificans TaxID=547122 RepID=A0A369CBR0_9GAMM|nr:zinc ABC transporter permease subunit ZnuB [Thioalbus denitrificans]RCX31329.1 zinc transport system permease protein [Thioalbus denitrificans]
MDEFLLRALLAGLGVALVAGPLGAFVVWRRMAYFGDTLAHSALLGVALAYLLSIDLNLGVLIACVAVALVLLALQRQQRLASDTLLGILAHTALSLGLVTLAFLETLRVDLMGFLFGDILAVGWRDVALIWAGGLVVLGALALLWRPLLAITVHEELAQVEGVPVVRVRLALTLLLAVVVALAMKVVGILLITSLLIIPAAAARRFSRTPEAMAALAALAGGLAVTGGLAGSLRFDTPAGPSVVVAAALLFALTGLVPRAGRG